MSALVLSCIFRTTAFAEVNQETQSFIECLDNRLEIEESNSGYSIVLDLTGSDTDIAKEVHDYYWEIVQLLNDATIGNDLVERGGISCFMKKDEDIASFYVSDFKNHWEFYTSTVSLSRTDTCSPLVGVFEHTYNFVFGGHDYKNCMDVEIYDYLTKENVSYVLPTNYQNVCYLVYSNLSKECEVEMTSYSITVKVVSENTFDAGADEVERLGKLMSETTPTSMFSEHSIPFENMLIYYMDNNGNRLASVKADLTGKGGISLIDRNDEPFVNGFCS